MCCLVYLIYMHPKLKVVYIFCFTFLSTFVQNTYLFFCFIYIEQICDLIQSHGFSKSISEDDAEKNIPCHRLLHCKEKNSGGSNDRLLAILYTSGSTGIPKGARILHTGAINRLKWQWNEFPYKTGDVCAFKVIQNKQIRFSKFFCSLKTKSNFVKQI